MAKPTNIVMSIDPQVHSRIKILAVSCGVPIYKLTNLVFKLGLEELGKRYSSTEELLKAIQKKK